MKLLVVLAVAFVATASALTEHFDWDKFREAYNDPNLDPEEFRQLLILMFGPDMGGVIHHDPFPIRPPHNDDIPPPLIEPLKPILPPAPTPEIPEDPAPKPELPEYPTPKPEIPEYPTPKPEIPISKPMIPDYPVPKPEIPISKPMIPDYPVPKPEIPISKPMIPDYPVPKPEIPISKPMIPDYPVPKPVILGAPVPKPLVVAASLPEAPLLHPGLGPSLPSPPVAAPALVPSPAASPLVQLTLNVAAAPPAPAGVPEHELHIVDHMVRPGIVPRPWI